jgi:hypothetical protein
MPDGIHEVEGYKEVWESDGAATQATRIFDVPWRIRKLCVDWWLGYDFNYVPSLTGGYAPPPAGVSIDDLVNGITSWSVVQPLLGGPLGGKISRIVPAQHPEFPWLYASRVELQEGKGVATQRQDITVRRNAAGTPFIEWEDPRSVLGANRRIFANDGGVIVAQGALADLLTRQTRLSTYPLVNLNPNQGDPSLRIEAIVQLLRDLLGDPTLVSGAQITDPAQITPAGREMRSFLASPSLAEIQNVASNAVAGPANIFVRYLAAMQALQFQISAAKQTLIVARENAINAAATRTMVPMIAYRGRDTTTGAPTADGSDPTMPRPLARYQVLYTPRMYEVRTDREMNEALSLVGNSTELNRYVERDRTYSIKSFQILPSQALKFVEGDFIGQLVPAPGSRLFPITEFTYTWHHVPDVPEDAIDACQGRLNLEPFDGVFGWRLFAPGTLLMMSPHITRTPRNVRGRINHKIVFKFLFTPQGWNRFPDANGNMALATFGGVLNDSTKLVYKLADFTTLFTQPLPRDYQVAGHG